MMKYNVRIEPGDKNLQGSPGVYLTSTIWFSGLMSWTWGTLMLMVLPVCSVC